MPSIRIRRSLDTDVVIAGAGPAGASAAVFLAEAGVRATLLDWASFPRDKVCGDFVGPVALQELRNLGITELEEYSDTNIIRSASLFLDGRELITHPIPEIDDLPCNGRVIPRVILDNLLFERAQRAGVETLEETRLVDYQVDADGVCAVVQGPRGDRRFNARMLFGADGCGSLVARKVKGAKSSRQDRIVAVRAYYEDVSGPDDRCDLFFSSKSFPGYYWLFPTGNGGANIGIGMLLETEPATGEHPRNLLLDLLEQDPALRSRLCDARLVGKIKGWPLITYNATEPIVDDSVVLLGDAAGLINPLNGEGIQYAILSGRWAADATLACLRARDFSKQALKPYADRVQDEMRYDMALSGMIVQLIRNRSLNPLWLHALKIITARAKVDPDYAKVTGGVLAGLLPASSVLTPPIVLRTLQQAGMTESAILLMHAVQGPKHLAAFGVETATSIGSMLWDTVRHPVGFTRWAGGVASSAIELAGQVGVNLVEGAWPAARTNPTPALPASEPTVRVRSCT